MIPIARIVFVEVALANMYNKSDRMYTQQKEVLCTSDPPAYTLLFLLKF